MFHKKYTVSYQFLLDYITLHYSNFFPWEESFKFCNPFAPVPPARTIMATFRMKIKAYNICLLHWQPREL